MTPPVKRRWQDYIGVGICLVAVVVNGLDRAWAAAFWAFMAALFALGEAEWRHDYHIMKRDHDIERDLRRRAGRR